MKKVNEESLLELIFTPDSSIYQSLLENMGMGFVHPAYIETTESQNKADEFEKILEFLNKYLEYYAQNNNVAFRDLSIEFINYGRTELVFVMTKNDGERLTLSVKQPAVKFGEVYQEMQYLLELNEKDKNVVAPIDYFQLGNQELYVTPYINQARCIASDKSWGMYIPEPCYRFQPFSMEQERVVNVCMISKLVSLYDFEKQEGLSCCKLGGGDFMLPKGWENEEPTIEDTLGRLYLIAARKKVKCSFEDYIQLIRAEFSRATIYEDQSELIVNLRGRVPMQVADIEAGIKLGRKIIEPQGDSPVTKALTI